MTRTTKGLLVMILGFTLVYWLACNFPLHCMWIAVGGAVAFIFGMMLRYINARTIKTNNEARWAYIGE